jgi:hypothetical protein
LALPLCLPWLLTVVTLFHNSWAGLWSKKLPLFRSARTRGATDGARNNFWLANVGLKTGCEVNSLVVLIADIAVRTALDDRILIIFKTTFRRLNSGGTTKMKQNTNLGFKKLLYEVLVTSYHNLISSDFLTKKL